MVVVHRRLDDACLHAVHADEAVAEGGRRGGGDSFTADHAGASRAGVGAGARRPFRLLPVVGGRCVLPVGVPLDVGAFVFVLVGVALGAFWLLAGDPVVVVEERGVLGLQKLGSLVVVSAIAGHAAWGRRGRELAGVLVMSSNVNETYNNVYLNVTHMLFIY